MRDETIRPVKHNSVDQKKPFKPGNWLATINFINHLVLFNNILMAVFAEPGNGKTTFGELLRTDTDQMISSCVVKATKGFTIKDFLLQVQKFDPSKTGETFSAFVENINTQKVHTLITIDDAQYLSEDFLQEILFAITNYQPTNFFHICLLSDYSLVACLNDLEANQFKDKVHSIELGALTESETKTYILKNLSSPKRIDQTMTDKRLEKFYLLTGGNIARINRQMNDFFNSDSFNPAPPKKVPASRINFNLVASSAFILLGAVFLWQNPYLFDHFQKNSANPAPLNNAPRIAETRLPSQIPAFTVAAVKNHSQPRPLKRVFDLRADEEGDLEKLVVMDSVVATPKTLKKHSGDAPLHSNLVAINTLFENRDLQASQGSNISEENVKEEIDYSVPAESKKEILTVAKTAETAAKTVAKGNYTVQLMASRNQQDLKRFINKYLRDTSAKISTVSRDGMDWYVLTVGEYNKKVEATHAIKEFPVELAKLKPWIRPTNDLHELG